MLSEGEDEVVWSLSSFGSFIVKSPYAALSLGARTRRFAPVWKARIPFQFKIFLWQAVYLGSNRETQPECLPLLCALWGTRMHRAHLLPLSSSSSFLELNSLLAEQQLGTCNLCEGAVLPSRFGAVTFEDLLVLLRGYVLGSLACQEQIYDRKKFPHRLVAISCVTYGVS